MNNVCIDCGKKTTPGRQYKTGRCRECKAKYKNSQKLFCSECGKEISGRGSTGLCQNCVSKSRWLSDKNKCKKCGEKMHCSRKKDLCVNCDISKCSECGKEISGRGSTGLCQNCYAKTDAVKNNMNNIRPKIPWNKGINYEDIWTDEEIKEKFGHSFSHTIEAKKKISEKAKKMWASGRGPKKCVSKPEKLLKEMLKKYDIKFKQQFRITQNNLTYSYDFYLCDFNMLIEVDGIYWHCRESDYPVGTENDMQLQSKERDKIKNILAKENGYKMIRIWEDELYKTWRIV